MSKVLDILTKHKSSKIGEFSQIYSKILNPYLNKNIVLLEIGVRRGESFKAYVDIFENSQLYGLDIGFTHGSYVWEDTVKELEEYGKGRAKVITGSQDDEELLHNLGKEVMEKYGGFDIIIDDGSHIMEHQQTSLKVLSQYMKPFGTYIIEDIETSYYPRFGGTLIKDHNFGKKNTTTELLKKLVDVINRDFTEGQYKHKNPPAPRRNVSKYSVINGDSKIFSMEIFPNCAVLHFGYFEMMKHDNKTLLLEY